MAYQPKYAQTKTRPEKTVIREQVQPYEVPRKEPKKMSKGLLIFFVILGFVVVPLSSFLTVRFMGDLLKNVVAISSEVVCDGTSVLPYAAFGGVTVSGK